MIRVQLERDIKERLKKELTDELIKEYLDRVTPTINKEVNKRVERFCLNGLEKYADLMRQRDEYVVYLEWREEET